jgi:pilus assembly protein FimV
MFRGGAPARGAGAPPPALAPAMDMDTAFDTDTIDHAPKAGSSLDFDMGEMLHDEPPATRDADRSPPKDVGLDFDLGGTGSTPAAGLDLEFDTETKTPSGGADKGGLDMDFNIHEEEPAPARGSGGIDFAISAEPLADNEISLDFDAPARHDAAADEGLTFAMDDAAADNHALGFETSGEAAETDVAVDEEPQWDETATKLDLAKAYIDMGDAEGARSILDEVLAEGNESQKAQARELGGQIR